MVKLFHRLIAWLILEISQVMGRERCGLRVAVDLDGLVITAHEATVVEIRNWLKGLVTAKEFDSIDAMLFEDEDVTVSDLVRLSDASRAVIESLPPSQLVKLAQAIKDANPFFFRYRQHMYKIDKLQNNA